ncbi:hypothetical protein VX037_13090 [Gordonia sp. Z-3]|uniref:Uncharacterized protein n=1 Tax=Gordonia aquimaris TaxID=2984863 RepID=A0A9X3I4U7_9ACTN|nr:MULTISPECIES: hypothetical protein [Gordonia]MCX2964365.1 hypothetical protein [Gordonia aquimaris]MED5801966.1 hypothetical protein [Gordonia sp. Z-3]
MTEPHLESADGHRAATPRPAPNMMPRAVGSTIAADETSETRDPASVTGAVGAILEQVDEIRRATGDRFDLAALGQQADLLERAHDVLTTALEDVDPR